MGIRDRLAARNAEFVSLRALLEQMADSEGVTLAEAAEALSLLLNQAGGGAPKWTASIRGNDLFDVPRSELAIASLALCFVMHNNRLGTSPEVDPDDIPF